MHVTQLLQAFLLTKDDEIVKTTLGAGPPLADTKQDAPPVAVSRVGRCELPLQVHRPQRNRRIRAHCFHADKTAPLYGAPSTSRKIKGRANITGAPFET
jgi:hypothetical protein